MRDRPDYFEGANAPNVRGVNRVVFLTEYPLNARDYQRFGIETLLANGFELEVWDFTPLLHDVAIVVSDPVQFAGYRRFSDRQDAIASILSLPRTAYIMSILSYRVATLAIYRAISAIGVPYALLENNAVPHVRKVSAQQLLARLRGMTPARLVERVLSRMPYSRLGIRPATFILAGGEKSVDVRTARRRAQEILWLHALDYDIYLKQRETPAVVDQHLGVFLDELYPFHPDYRLMGIVPPITAAEYYSAIGRLFHFLEETHASRIVIAGHPRSSPHHDRYFGGREVVRGNTADLVRRSRFVIAHSSTSINFAVLFRKPIIFATTEKLRRWFLGQSIDLTASLLGKQPVNLDRPIAIDFNRELSVDEELYAQYVHAYIKRRGTEDRLFWQQVADHLRST